MLVKKHGGSRAGAGRKKKDNKALPVFFRIQKDLYDILEVEAKNNNLSIGLYVRELVINSIKNK